MESEFDPDRLNYALVRLAELSPPRRQLSIHEEIQRATEQHRFVFGVGTLSPSEREFAERRMPVQS